MRREMREREGEKERERIETPRTREKIPIWEIKRLEGLLRHLHTLYAIRRKYVIIKVKSSND